MAVKKVIVCDGEKQLRATNSGKGTYRLWCLLVRCSAIRTSYCCRPGVLQVAGGHGKVSMKRTPMCLREYGSTSREGRVS